MMRLDKFLTECEAGSRSQVKAFIKKGLISVDGVVCRDAGQKLDENTCRVCYMGQPFNYTAFRYYLLNKPAGVVTATRDKKEKTVLDLLVGISPKDLFAVGRLDKDTQGLLLITNDGALAHALLSPKKHVDKTYLVKLRDRISLQAAKQLEAGVDIGEDKPTLPAKVQILDDTTIYLTIHEGKFHQVKRMLKAVGNEVLFLKRTTFGPLTLEDSLAPGNFRALTEEEIQALRKASGPKE